MVTNSSTAIYEYDHKRINGNNGSISNSSSGVLPNLSEKEFVYTIRNRHRKLLS